MKKILTAFAALALSLGASAQTMTEQAVPAAAADSINAVAAVRTGSPATPKFGTVRYDSLLHSMPEWELMKGRLANLRQKYEAEAYYNESALRRMFAEFLQGQKDFPQSILLKRQRDLQEAMEKGLSFRREADSLLIKAQTDLEAPLRAKLNAAIRQVATQRGYDCVVNLDDNSMPFTKPQLTEDASPMVGEKLRK